MDAKIKSGQLHIGGMTCISCQNKIERKLLTTAGVQSAVVSYRAGTAKIAYDPDRISLNDISALIQKLDYEVLSDRVPPADTRRAVGLLIILLALFMLARQWGLTDIFYLFPTAEAGMSYGMLFVIGLLTSVHCVAMCGGINLSQCLPQYIQAEGPAPRPALTTLRPGFLYNLGRVTAYTLVGFLVGALGSVASLSSNAQGGLKLIAGLFMIIMGLNLLGLFPFLRALTPQLPRSLTRKIDAQKSSSSSPLIVGLLNGLMPCGPLQAMQLYALSTGSALAGALAMLLFALGTVPLMLALSTLSAVLSKKFTHRMVTAGAALVIMLGLSMFAQGWGLTGFSLAGMLPDTAEPGGSSAVTIQIENGVQLVNSTLDRGRYPAITVQAGMPVKWTIEAPPGSLNGCNNIMQIPAYELQYQFKTGENVIEFTPDKTGKIPYSCWMGMIRSSITVVDAEI
jgi:sulfite exporter TauE/SafE/copper chaperone CopZ